MMLVHKWYFWVIGLSIVAALITIPVAVYFTLEDGDVCSISDTSSCVERKGVCGKDGSTWKCICNEGYKNVAGTTKACQDIDECYSGDTSSCMPDKGTCFNMESTWRCKCNYGYKNPVGDTKTCEIKDTCSKVDTSSCEADKGSCVNLIDNWNCECNEGYRNPLFDLKSCEVDPCGSNTDITTEEGELEFPSGGRYYGSEYVDCKWTLSTDPANIFVLIFTRFEMSDLGGCVNQFLEIEDGYMSLYSQYIHKFCGDAKPGDNGVFFSKNNNIRLTISCNDVSRNGITLTWRAVPVEHSCVTKNTKSCREDTGVCVPTKSTWMCYCKPGYKNPAGDDKTCI